MNFNANIPSELKIVSPIASQCFQYFDFKCKNQIENADVQLIECTG